MTRALYALLVGIDDYAPSVTPLHGCVNDVTAFQGWLEARTQGGEFQLRPRVLLNSDATRASVIAGFREHLAQADLDDVALFYYSGHGSQEQTPDEFLAIEPDGLNETLVCWDSREPGGWDLADKELAHLIASVAAHGAHVVILLDSCHSGSATRDVQPQTAVRWIPAAHRQRPLSSYLFAPSEVDSLRPADRAANPSGWWTLPQGRHILLAACQDSQTAKEYHADGKTWGAFSYFLRTTLEGTKGVLTYRELAKQAQARVRANISAQSPQLEASQADDVDQPFLGGAIAARPTYTTVSYDGSHWMLDAGAIHGISLPMGTETTTLALFPLEATPDDLRHLAHAVGQVQVIEVLPQVSRVELQGAAPLDTARTYKAIVTGLPLPPLEVQFEGEAQGLELVRTALSHCSPGGGPSLYVQESARAPELRLIALGGQYTLTRPHDERPLVARLQGYSAENARQAVQRLEHIARWIKTANLQNPATHLPADAVAFDILQDSARQDPSHLLFQYRYQNGQWQQPAFTIHLKNQSDQTLYCAVLDLTESFAIDPVLSPQPVVKLEPGQAYSQELPTSVPKEVWLQGITDRQDILKLVASTAEFDARLLGQGKPEASRDVTRAARGAARDTLSRLMLRVQTREVGRRDEDETYTDWITSQVVVTTRRPLETQPVPQAGQTLSLGAGVTLGGHPSLVAQVHLASVPPASRDLGTPGLPPLLRESPAISQPFYFQVLRSAGASENVIELRNVQNHAAVTPEQPLRLTIAAPLARGETVLAFGFDGEFFLPLGVSRRAGNQTRIDLQRLPAPCGTRDLVSTIRILFQKFVAQPLGLDYPYPILAAATVTADGQVTYEKNPDRVKQQVAQAHRITLFIHGITGDTRGMVASARNYAAGDLLLTFDYESVNTPIEETARKLKERLESVGLGAGHGKPLRLVVHSLGGLVARWFVEREGGNKIVNHLVILGTPSAGSPWSTVQKWVTLGVGLALNGLTTVAWPVKVLGGLISAFEKIDVTLDQFQPGSEFLQSLAASPDPHVRYTLIVGNTSVILSALEVEPGQTDSRLRRLATKLGYGLASLAFFEQPNDIAVSVQSVKSVPMNRFPAPEVREIACDHVTFFDSSTGLDALAQSLVA